MKSKRFSITLGRHAILCLLSAFGLWAGFGNPTQSHGNSFDASVTKVLLIGDSHSVGAYGRELELLFRESFGQRQIALYASCGSSPGSWISGRPTRCGYREKVGENREISVKSHSTPIAASVVREWIGEIAKPLAHPRSILVISHGANLVPSSSRQIQKEMTAFLKVLNQETHPERTRCIWVGPPDSRHFSDEKTAQTADLIRAQLGNQCEFVDSRTFTNYPAKGGDGIHFDSLGPKGRELARKWAQGVFHQIGINTGAREVH